MNLALKREHIFKDTTGGKVCVHCGRYQQEVCDHRWEHMYIDSGSKAAVCIKCKKVHPIRVTNLPE